MTAGVAVAPLGECDDVTVAYGVDPARVTALRHVTLSVRGGEGLALCGRSGSGKTTVLHALGGLVEPTEGVVRWRGDPLSTLDAAARGRARARGIAYVFQGSNLLPHFTAEENVAFTGAAEPGELLALVGLEGKRESMPSELSGGEAQRVAIARAVGQRAELLLCDEPTGHLDSDTGRRMLNLIEALKERFGFALVIATHDVDVAARADRIVTLGDGRVVDDEAAR